MFVFPVERATEPKLREEKQHKHRLFGPDFPPFSPFFCLFRPLPEGAKSTWEIQKTEEKGLFPQISSDLLKPPSLKPPFAALQSDVSRIFSAENSGNDALTSLGGHFGPLRPDAQGSKSFSPPPGPQENALFGVGVHDFWRGRP